MYLNEMNLLSINLLMISYYL